MAKVKISFRGCGTTIVKAKIENELWQSLVKAAIEINSTVELGLFDSDFFETLNHPLFKSWQNFDNLFNIYGLGNNSKSFVEIKIDNKTRQKIYFRDLLNQNFLFPLFNTETVVLNATPKNVKTIAIVESDIGLVAVYKFSVNDFNIEDIKFCFTDLDVGKTKFQILNKVFYKNKELKSTGNDSVVINNFALIEN